MPKAFLLNTPLVSVLTTAYNREKYIAEAVESILASTYTNFELIIVDDGSSDQTVEIARTYERKDPRIKVYVNEKNLGDYPNRNKAASYAKGKYLKYLDSDDILYPHCLEMMVNSMEKYSEAGFGLASIADPATPFPVCIPPGQIYRENFTGILHFNRAPGSSIIKRQVFESVGGFSGERYIGDMDLWYRLAQKNYMVKFPRDMTWARVHDNAENIFESKSDSIKIQRRKLVDKYLHHPDCPLTRDEIHWVEKILRKKKAKNKIIRILSKMGGVLNN